MQPIGQSAKRRKRRPLADPVVMSGDSRVKAGEMGMSTMSTKSLIGIWLTLMLFLAGTASAQGMGDRKGYDYMGTPDMGTPVVSGDTQMGEYVNPYAAGRPEWDPYGQGTSASGSGLDPFAASGTAYGAYSLQLEPVDPASMGLTIRDTASLSNQLYLQRGLLLVTEGSVALGEPYTLWARVAGRGGFSLYDYNNPLFQAGESRGRVVQDFRSLCGFPGAAYLSLHIRQRAQQQSHSAGGVGIVSHILQPDGKGGGRHWPGHIGSEGGAFQ